MAFEIVAERDSATVTMKRNSSLMAIAKARVWASEGWNVTIRISDDAPLSLEQYLTFLPGLAEPDVVLAS